MKIKGIIKISFFIEYAPTKNILQHTTYIS